MCLCALLPKYHTVINNINAKYNILYCFNVNKCDRAVDVQYFYFI